MSANKTKELENGILEVTISFDITDHNHTFGASRNYKSSEYSAMINDKDVQNHIKNGYCIGFYSHSNRSIDNGYVANERNDKGELVEPVCKTVAMAIEGNIVTHTQHILPTGEGEKVKKLIKTKTGGFSSVHNLKQRQFFGMDFVLTPNLNGNRVIVDSICSGVCEIDKAIDSMITDAVGATADDEVKEIARELLMKDDTVVDMIKIKDFVDALKKDKSDIEINFSQITKELDKAKAENETLITSLDEATIKNKTINDNYQDFIKNDYQNIITQLDGLGIKLVDGKLEMQKDSLDSLFKPKNFDELKKVDFDAIAMLNKKDFKVIDRPSFKI